MSVDVGSKAPDFTLTNQDRQPVTLSGLQRQAGRARVLPGGVQLGVPEGAVHVPRLDGAARDRPTPRSTASASTRSLRSRRFRISNG